MIKADYINNFNFCHDLFRYSRRITRTVMIGDIPLGGNYPLRIQSMTNTDPDDLNSTINQIIELADAGSDYVRLTIPALKDASNLEIIKKKLLNRHIHVPLIADVHFNPAIAEHCARIVEKVRINPGNYVDKKHLVFKIFSEKEYEQAFEQLAGKLEPLINVCKEYGTALRIGTNHGSLSDRIMSRYGDTIEGMVESTLEYVRICRDFGFHELVLSIKSSNPVIMTDAYRLLVAKMNEEQFDYPLHLGVTEAGEGEEGRIKSAIGTAALLEDGIGDTIRVSLAENPVHEIPAAWMIINRYEQKQEETAKNLKSEFTDTSRFIQRFIPALKFQRKSNLRADRQAVVVADMRYGVDSVENFLQKSVKAGQEADFFYLGKNIPPVLNNLTIKWIGDFQPGIRQGHEITYLYEKTDFLSLKETSSLHFVKLEKEDAEDRIFVDKIRSNPATAILLDLNHMTFHESRYVFFKLDEYGIKNNIILLKSIKSYDEQSVTDISIETGALLADGFGDGICLSSLKEPDKGISLAFNILQAVKRRITKTEFVMCPTCGRTQFDLQQVSGMVKSRLSHLKGLKIGIMGCIVNGLGEMGDADYGFIGSGRNDKGIGRVSLYRNKQLVKRNIELDFAVEELIQLIKEDGRWSDR